MALDQNIGMVTAYAYARSKGYTGTEDEFAEALANAGVTLDQIADAVDEFIDTTVPAKVAEVTAEGTRQIGLVSAEGTAQVSAVQSAGSARVTEVESAIEAKGAETLASIPDDYTALSNDVSELRSDLLAPNVNLLDPRDFEVGKLLVNGGGLSDNASQTTSGYFEVTGGATYYVYRSDTYSYRLSFYSARDESAFISMLPTITDNYFVVPSNATYARMSTNKSMILDMGIYSTDIGYYVPYSTKLAEGVSIELHIDDTLTEEGKAADAKKVGEIAKNVVIPEAVYTMDNGLLIKDERLNITTGAIVTSSSNQCRSDFIPVSVGDYLQTCAIRYLCLYNDRYEYLGYVNLWSSNDTVAPPSTWSGNYRNNLTQITAINDANPSYIRCWGVYNQYPPALTVLDADAYTVLNLGDSIFGNNEKPWDLGTFIQNITGLKDANCGYGGTTARVITSGNMAPLGLPSIVDCIVAEDFSALQTPSYWASKSEYMYAVPTLLFGMIDFTKIKIITIAYGTNDYNNNTPLDNAENRLDTSTYKGGLRYAVENLQTKYPDITLVMLSPIFRYWSNASDYSTVDDDSDSRTNTLGLKLTDYVTAMQEVAEEYHLPYFNNYENIGLNKFTAPAWLRDGTHLNRGLGAEKLGHIVAKEIGEIY